MKISPIHKLATLAFIIIVSLAVAACGAKEDSTVASEAPETTVPAAPSLSSPKTDGSSLAGSLAKKTQPADSSALDSLVLESNPVDKEPSDSQVSTAESVDSDSQVSIKDADADGPEEAAILLTSYTGYGFSLKLDLGADVKTSGWIEPEPSATQGIIAFSYGGVNTNLVWGPPEERTPLTFLADTYNILRASQPSVAFESISDGDILVNGQSGVYGGFKAVDNSGAAIGGGLIGAWTCGDSETSFRMTLTGEDATVVQLRFDRLLENFACSSSSLATQINDQTPN